jgi:thioredoxin 1
MRSRSIRIFVIALLVAVAGVSAPALGAEKKPAPKQSTKAAKKADPKAKKSDPKAESDPKAKSDPKPAETPLPKLLDLGSDKCIPCKMMIPVLDELKKDYKGKLTVEFIDVWKDRAAGDKYKVKAIPTQIFYDAKGKELFRHVGFYPKADIVAKFKELGIKLEKEK